MQSLNLRKTAQDQFLPVKLISSEEPFSAQAQGGASLGLCRTLQVLSPFSIDAATVSICKPLATEEGLILTILDIFPHKKQASRQRYMGKTSGSPALQQCLSEQLTFQLFWRTKNKRSLAVQTHFWQETSVHLSRTGVCLAAQFRNETGQLRPRCHKR